MKKLILNWLFGTDNVEEYIDLLHKCIEHNRTRIDDINSHLKTLKREEEGLKIIRKLIKICENHGIDADEEIKHIELK
jgi:hypothetical protein